MRNTRKLTCLAAMLMITIGACKKDDDNNDNAMNAQDRDFMMRMTYSNNAEIDAGSMASAMGTNASVKSFGSMMISDHTTAQNDLKTAATGESLPTGLDPEHVALKAYLSTMTGYSFDTAYIHSQVMDHQKTINLMQQEASNGSNQRLKNYVNTYLPKVMMHHHMADSISHTL